MSTSVVSLPNTRPRTLANGRVMVVDDDPSIRTALHHVLGKVGHEVWACENGDDALRALENEGPFDAAMIDLHMPGMGGMEVFEHLHARDPSVSAIVMTGHASVDTAVATFRLGGFDYVTKPFTNIFEVCHGVVGPAVMQGRRRRESREDIARSTPLPKSGVFDTFVHAGRELGPWVLDEKIGSGGMGEVWLAHHQHLGHRVAVKIHRPQPSGEQAGSVGRFEREARITTQLSHPNTVRAYDYGVSPEGLRFIAMEFLDGPTVASLVESQGPLAPGRAMWIAMQVLGSLSEAHGAGIVHRDIKPDNVFVTRIAGIDEYAKLVDFGVAHMRGDRITEAGKPWIGTPAFISPEVVKGDPVGAEADIYGVGALLYFMLAGRPPFTHPNVAALLLAQVRDSPPPLAAASPHRIPSELETVVHRCLAKDPRRRFRSAAALALTLQRLIARHYPTGEHVRPIAISRH